MAPLRPRTFLLPLAGLVGAAVAVLPGLAAGDAPSTASFTAVDYAFHANGGTGNQVTIAQGGTVTISYPSGSSEHNADFGTGPQPSGCTQTSGINSGSVPPLPHTFEPASWSGTCTFNTPGTYTFHCDLHAYMTGTITVQAPGTTTGTTTTGTTTTTTTTTPAAPPTGTTTGTTTTSPPPPTEPTRPQLTGVGIPSHQRGTRVRGSAKVAGGRLEVDLLVSARALGAGGSKLVRVGRGLLTPRSPAVRFTVPLDNRAKRVLHVSGRLTVTVELLVRSSSGAKVSAKRIVRLQG